MSRDDRNNLLHGHNDIVVPLAYEVVQSLFGWLSKTTDLPGRKRNEHDDADACQCRWMHCRPYHRTIIKFIIPVLKNKVILLTNMEILP